MWNLDIFGEVPDMNMVKHGPVVIPFQSGPSYKNPAGLEIDNLTISEILTPAEFGPEDLVMVMFAGMDQAHYPVFALNDDLVA